MKVSLFLTAFLASHKLKASATPDQHFDPRHPRSRSDDRRHGYLFGGSLRARGSSRQKSPSSPASRSDLRARGKPRRGGALACSPMRRSGPAETGSASAAAGQFCGWQAASIGAHGRLDAVAGGGLMFTVRAHLRKHRDLLQPSCDCPSPIRYRGRLATCTAVIGEVSAGGEGEFCRPLAREGGRPTKFPRSRRYSRSRGGQGRRQVGRAAGASREVVWGRLGAVARSGRRRHAGLSWERVRACWGQDACASVNPE
jgi:hypothetical protein